MHDRMVRGVAVALIVLVATIIGMAVLPASCWVFVPFLFLWRVQIRAQLSLEEELAQMVPWYA